MNELIKITTNENGQRLVSARELHEKLEIKTRFSLWIEQYIKEDNKYGFENNVDFTSVVTTTVVNNGAKRNLQDYALTIDTAKEVSMLTGTEKGREIRKYFITCEKQLKQSLTLTQEEKFALRIYNCNDPMERMTILSDYGTYKEQQKELLLTENIIKPLQQEVMHKEDVIVSLVEDISLQEKRQRINQIIRYGANGRYSERWNLLYKEFSAKYHIDLNRRMKSEEVKNMKPKIKSKMDYIDRVMNMTPQLYEVCVKVFENDVEKLKEEWESTITREF